MVIYLEITRDPNLSHAAKLLYGRLCLFAGKNGMCNPSHERWLGRSAFPSDGCWLFSLSYERTDS